MEAKKLKAGAHTKGFDYGLLRARRPQRAHHRHNVMREHVSAWHAHRQSMNLATVMVMGTAVAVRAYS